MVYIIYYMAIDMYINMCHIVRYIKLQYNDKTGFFFYMYISYIKRRKTRAFSPIVVDLQTHHDFQAFSFTLSHFLNS